MKPVDLKPVVFWDVMPCSLVDRYQNFGRTCFSILQLPFLPWTWRQQTPTKHWHLSVELHDLTLPKAEVVMFTAMKTSSLTCRI
jgi:hypothetical protein